MSELKRSSNFTTKEESILLCLVRKYRTILENMKTDTNNNRNKLECWKVIEKQFNNESGQIFRDSSTLCKKYENLKKRTKKFADEKCYALGTGGGPPKKPPEETDIDLDIKEILAERIDGLPSEFGGDAGGGSNSLRKRNEYDAMCGKVSHWATSKGSLESEKVRFAEEEHKKIELMQKKV